MTDCRPTNVTSYRAASARLKPVLWRKSRESPLPPPIRENFRFAMTRAWELEYEEWLKTLDVILTYSAFNNPEYIFRCYRLPRKFPFVPRYLERRCWRLSMTYDGAVYTVTYILYYSLELSVIHLVRTQFVEISIDKYRLQDSEGK